MNALHGLSVWNRACALAVHTYGTINDCADQVFRDQITRACLAVPTHIAEGYERASKRQFALFLEVAKGSCAELRTQLYIAAQLDLITLQRSTELMQESLEVSQMLQRLIGWCEVQPDAPPAGRGARRVPAD